LRKAAHKGKGGSKLPEVRWKIAQGREKRKTCFEKVPKH